MICAARRLLNSTFFVEVDQCCGVVGLEHLESFVPGKCRTTCLWTEILTGIVGMTAPGLCLFHASSEYKSNSTVFFSMCSFSLGAMRLLKLSIS